MGLLPGARDVQTRRSHPYGRARPREPERGGHGAILAHAFERYFTTAASSARPIPASRWSSSCSEVGVDEIACLIDFGVPSPRVLEHLTHLDELKRRCTASSASPDRSIAAEIRRHSVTHLQCTPSLATMLLASPETQDRLKDIRVLLVGGEALPVHVAKQLVDLVGEGTVINMYGPTETTIWSATHRLDGVEDTVPIGRPIANTQMYVLDSALRPTPLGVPGELYIGGDGVARGYLGRPALTSERFLADPFRNAPDALLYRTGDVARFRTDGALEFLGRVDHQVKVRGHRIELGEIEVTLSSIRRCAAPWSVAREDRPGDQRLVAYVVPRPTARTVDGELREHLKKHLPDFMLPSHFVLLPEFPLTPNKKVDRKALPPPDQVQAESGPDQAPPQGAVEERIARIWQDLLGVRAVGRNANFFDLGGSVTSSAAAAIVPSYQRVAQRGLVDDRPARGVDEDRGRLHRGQGAGVDQMGRLRCQRAVQRDDVGGGEQLRQARSPCSTRVDDLHAEALGASRDRVADPAQPDDAEHGAVELEAQVTPAAPTSASRRRARRPVASGRRRAAARISANVRSAVAAVSTSGVLPTAMPRRRARRDVDVVDADAVVGDRADRRAGVEQLAVDAVGDQRQQRVGLAARGRSTRRAAAACAPATPRPRGPRRAGARAPARAARA